MLFYGPGQLRVAAHLGQAHTAQPSLVVVAKPERVAFDVQDANDFLTLTGALNLTFASPSKNS